MGNLDINGAWQSIKENIRKAIQNVPTIIFFPATEFSLEGYRCLFSR
jgi:hypothetical protein